jgi:acyl transferase domain-containing protein
LNFHKSLTNILGQSRTTGKYTATGVAGCMASNRLSYFFNLTGPSISVDSACSSSTYALHAACQSLRAAECDAAFVGASSLAVNHHSLVQLDTHGIMSPDGRCYSYDARANGFGRGEGASCLILKRLDRAIEAGDPIHAAIRNTSANHSGRTRGITMPSQTAQKGLLTRVHSEVGLRPSDTDVVEGHGTGTSVGDPVDAGAAANVIAKDREDKLHIGSIKSNFGHLHAASGLISVIKATLMLRHATIFPNADFDKMNRQIDASKLRVAQSPVPWLSEGRPRRVCVTNFGFGGSNVTVIFEEFGRHETLPISESRQSLYPLSAQSDTSLFNFQASLGSHLNDKASSTAKSFMADLSYTLGMRRTHFSRRTAFVAGSPADLRLKLVSSPSPSSIAKRAAAGLEPAICFAFTGQGAQYAQMGSGLARLYKPFAQALAEAEIYLNEFGATWSLTEELAKSEDSRINEAEVSQPACTAVQVGLVRLLRCWGITPAAVVGHSSGEIAAAYAAGFVYFRTAMALAFLRGQVAAELSVQTKNGGPQGGMFALGTDPDTATALLQPLGNWDVLALLLSIGP